MQGALVAAGFIIRRLSRAVPALLLLSAAALPGYAEGGKKSDGSFFEPGFVQNPVQVSKDELIDSKDKSTELVDARRGDEVQGETADKPSQAEDEQDGNAADAEDDTQGQAAITDTQDVEGGKKIQALSLIVRAEPESHLINTLDTYHTLLKDRRLKGGTIYIYKRPPGYYSQQLTTLLTLCGLYGTVYRNISALPDKYEKTVKRSPAWILSLPDGEVVVDGVKSPAKFLNAKGDFIKPEQNF